MPHGNIPMGHFFYLHAFVLVELSMKMYDIREMRGIQNRALSQRMKDHMPIWYYSNKTAECMGNKIYVKMEGLNTGCPCKMG